ncbi:MAG: DUF4271 domain-containing protein [Flavobacteriales bacterium]|uniref:DUF4271 domain-containing protein n=1 Tax=Candidatus Ulvibacter alkanivorans TaxID=2267620 RepID=UPI000DF40A19|nr:DUF4271 domain-containing protein [Candidatus Ulvibacter alkanivorans]MCH2490351.1 DUF4271 domain-containing protein [Flavobacteriales bacterium]
MERHIESVDWITISLVGILIIYALAKYAYPKRFQEFIFLPVTNKYFLIQGKNDAIQHPFNILLFINQVLCVSLFIYVLFKTLRPDYTSENDWLFVQIVSGYVVFVFAKFCVEKILGAMFSIDSLINRYLYQKLSYRNLLSVVLFIGNILFYYLIQPTGAALLLFVGIVILLNAIALLYSYKTNGNLIIGNFFYFILYLCALEISPYIILYKVFVS